MSSSVNILAKNSKKTTPGRKSRGDIKLKTRLEAFYEEIDAVKQKAREQVGATDENYIRRIIQLKNGIEISSRIVIFAGAVIFNPIVLAVGIIGLSISQIIENMEIGHNIIHGQYDFMNDPKINSKNYEWDAVVPASQWAHSHNYVHHTYTNVVGRDYDVGHG